MCTLSDFFSHAFYKQNFESIPSSAGIHNGRDPHKELANVRRRKIDRREGKTHTAKKGWLMINRL